MTHNDAVYLGEFEGGQPAWLSTADRRRHLYIIGRSGTGKSTFLKNLMLDDLANGRPFSLIDPHGDLAIQIAASVPPKQTNNVIYLDLSDKEHHVGLNPLHGVAPADRPRAAAHVLATFVHAWQLNLDINARLLNVLNAGTRLLLDTPGSTLLGMQKLLVEERYRARLVANCQDPVIRQFWNHEVQRYSDRYETEAFAPLQSRLTLLLADPAIRHVLSQVKSTLDVGRLMDEGKSLLLRLPRGNLGEVPTYLLAALFATQFAQAAEARADQPEHERRDHTLILDEFQYASTTVLADILSGARKFRLHLILAHQFLEQIPVLLRKAIPANVGSSVVYEIAASDAAVIAPELTAFDPLIDRTTDLQTANRGIFDPAQLTNMRPFTAWVRLMQDGERSERRLLFPAYLDAGSRRRFEKVRMNSITSFTRCRPLIEAKLARFLGDRRGA